MRKYSAIGVSTLALLATGCMDTFNVYQLELTPRGSSLKRALTAYQTSHEDRSRGTSLPADELEAITRSYPPGSVKREGEDYLVTNEFAGAMPADIGGAGSYTYLSTSLGTAGWYAERFRGNDDRLALAETRLQAANRFTDLLVGWSQTEFGREPRFQELRRFLDVNFRHDIKNLTVADFFGLERGRAWDDADTDADERASAEASGRLLQYLIEHGYLRIDDIPELLRVCALEDKKGLARMVQRLVAAKLGVPASGPMPQSLAMLADPAAAMESWEKYLIRAGVCRSAVQEAEPGPPSSPSSEKPTPSNLMEELVKGMLGITSLPSNDHLTVRLSLPSPPLHTNGRWDDTGKQVTWAARIERGSDRVASPAICYAEWSHADAIFQTAHFGHVLLAGDPLFGYGLWRTGLDASQGMEWDGFLASLQPDEGLKDRLEAFRFAGEPRESEPESGPLASAFPRDLLTTALAASTEKAESEPK